MKMFRLVVAALVAVTVTGCSTFQYEGQSFAKNEDRVLVFNSTQVPAKSMWHIVGYAAIRQRANWCSDESLTDAMRLKAADLGADAIHITSVRLIPICPDTGLPISTAQVENDMGDPDQMGMATLQNGFGLPDDGLPSNHVIEKDDPQEYVRVLRAEFLRLNTKDAPAAAPAAPATETPAAAPAAPATETPAAAPAAPAGA